MRNQRIIIALSILALSNLSIGCSEDNDNIIASDTSTSMQTTAFDDAQGSCTNGGVKIEVLVNGVVQEGQTQYICNGVNGADGADGADGQNGQNGHSALVATSDDVSDNCTNGGMRIDFGLDTNDDGTLNDDEILSSRYVCNGANGANGADGADGQNGANGKDGADGKDGKDGASASVQTSQFSGAQGSCTNGGVKIEVLMNGVVQEGQTQYICNGTNGQDGQNGSDGQNGHSALVATSDDVSDNCTNGGMRIDFGLDTNDDGTLNDNEILSSRYVCNGANGQDGQNGSDGKNASIQTTAFTGAQGSCTNGGVKVDILIDGIVQADQTQYICNGANGADGQNDTNGADLIMCYAPESQLIIDSRIDSANCGRCGNVCQAGFKCVNSTCQRDDMSTATITCNAKTVDPYSNPNHCGGCNFACDVKICRAGMCVTPTVGDHIIFGHYEQDNIFANGKESIEWRVLDIKDGKALIISEKTLDVQPYNTTRISITWAKSTIRSWLNGYDASYNTAGNSYTSNNFIDMAFTAEEKAKIVASNVPAHKNPSYSSISPGVATTDKIFLLSITEANNYFKDNADRRAAATPYARARGASTNNYTDFQYSSRWWLRSPGIDTRDAASVDFGGSIRDFGDYVDGDYYAVRPAL